MRLLENKKGFAFISAIILGLVAVSAILFYVPGVLANTHDAIVTINPDVANCNDLPNTFTVNIENDPDVDGADNIFEVRIYESATGIEEGTFDCGDAPSGWTLSDYAGGDPSLTDYGYCEYKTTAGGSDMIDPGENLDFTFEAQMIVAQSCSSSFVVSTLDDDTPEGEHEYNDVYVYIDCTPPETTKIYGEPSFPLNINDGGNYPHFISINTPITLEAIDGSETCGLGVEEIQYRVSGSLADSFCESCEDWMTMFRPDIGPWQTYSEPFGIDEESCHVIEYRSIDVVDNEEEIRWQCVFVDDTPPKGSALTGQPRIKGVDCDWWIRDATQLLGTPITLTCNDQEPHLSGIKSTEYRWKLDGQWPVSNQNGDWLLYTDPIVFYEDSLHELEYRCTDNINHIWNGPGKKYRVDSLPPVITKEMIGENHLGYRDGVLNENACPPNEKDICYVADNELNGVNISVEDDQTYPDCAVNQISCHYELWWETSDEECGDGDYEKGWCLVDNDEFNKNKEIIFREDSNHKLIIECNDSLGNYVEDIEFFKVDSTAPETTKIYGEPHYPADINLPGPYPHWITTQTPITLNATDEKVGVDQIYWRYIVVENRWCETEGSGCQNYDEKIQEEFISYNGEVRLPEESCHLIEFYAVDKLGNEEEPKRQCVYVEDTSPVTNKTYEPDAYVNPSSGLEYIDTIHKVVLTADDFGPHPSGLREKQYRVSGSLADSFCEPATCDNWMTMLRPNMGAWNTYSEPFGIDEESCHVIEYRSIDNLGNEEEIKWQCVFVDKTLPTIEKTYEGAQSPLQIGSDTPYPHYINSETQVVIDVTDNGPHSSGVDTIKYSVSLLQGNDACNDDVICNETKVKSFWDDYIDSFTISEDSCHLIEIKAIDNVGKESYHRQCVFVDNQAPEINKTITGPQVNGEEPIHKYLTKDSIIKLECTDIEPHPVGEETIYWEMYWKYDGCEIEGGWGTVIDSGIEESGIKEFTNLSDSCHKFVYYCKDALGNTKEELNIEIDIVDNTPPTPNKTVEEPKTEWYPVDVAVDPFDPDATHFYPWIVDRCWNDQHANGSIDCWKVTLDTKISLDCEDPEPHPVNNEKVCFQVELDAEDWTEQYCQRYGEEYNGDGYCCTEETIEEFKFMEESEHNLKYYCVDDLGNKGPVDDEKFKVTGEMFKIRLNDKWNLISVPFKLINDDPAEVFEDAGSIQTVWSYDAAEKKWKVYREGEDYNETNNLEHIVPGDGYWVLADCEEPQEKLENFRNGCGGPDGDRCEMLIVGGSLYNPGPVVPPSKKLVEGWNLIGYYGTENRHRYAGPDPHHSYHHDAKEAYCGLYSLRNLEGGLFNPTKWSGVVGYWEPDNPGQWEDYGLCDRMDPGAGYWVSMDAEGSYKPETICEDSILNAVCSIF